jgi:hypothetical protein
VKLVSCQLRTIALFVSSPFCSVWHGRTDCVHPSRVPVEKSYGYEIYRGISDDDAVTQMIRRDKIINDRCAGQMTGFRVA